MLHYAWNGHLETFLVKSTSDSSKNIVGERRDAKRVMLEQQVEGITEGDVDPDRVKVLS